MKKLKNSLLLFLFGLFFNHPHLIAHDSLNLNQLFEKNKHSVVKINTKFKSPQNSKNSQLNRWFEEFFGVPFDSNPKQPSDQPDAQGFGSGIIMDQKGHIITNYHVLEDASVINVELSDRKKYEAQLIGYDKLTDIALIKINANQNLKPIRFGNSDALKVGDQVVAIGSPFGFDYSLTSGIVSAKKRSLGTQTRYVPFLQTDVAINPGNSGGPLLNLAGKIVGVNSAIISRTGSYAGLSFAIPFNLVKVIYNQIKNNGEVSRGWLGIRIQTLDEKVANSLGIQTSKGVLVLESEVNGPADQAGIRSGDIIIRFNGQNLNTSDELPPMVAALPVGSLAQVVILQNNTRKTIQVRLGELSNKQPTKITQNFIDYNINLLGLDVKPIKIDPQLSMFGYSFGLKIQKIKPGSLADSAGFESGDILLKAVVSYGRTEKKLYTARNLNDALNQAQKNGYIGLALLRDDRNLFLTVQLP